MFLSRGQARVEFIALKDEIQDLLELGHTRKSIHARFKEAGRITMTYRMFCRYVNKFFPKNRKEPLSQQAKSLAPIENHHVLQPAGSKLKGQKSFHDKDQHAEDVLDNLA